MSDEVRSLAEYANSMNEKLESTADAATNQAFNLGCLVGIAPLLFIVIATYFLTGRSWVGAAVMFVLMVLGLVLFANVVAAITRRNSLKRTYYHEIRPLIDQTLSRMQIERSEFDAAAGENLPPGASLRIFISPPETTSDTDATSANNIEI